MCLTTGIVSSFQGENSFRGIPQPRAARSTALPWAIMCSPFRAKTTQANLLKNRTILYNFPNVPPAQQLFALDRTEILEF